MDSFTKNRWKLSFVKFRPVTTNSRHFEIERSLQFPNKKKKKKRINISQKWKSKELLKHRAYARKKMSNIKHEDEEKFITAIRRSAGHKQESNEVKPFIRRWIRCTWYKTSWPHAQAWKWIISMNNLTVRNPNERAKGLSPKGQAFNSFFFLKGREHCSLTLPEVLRKTCEAAN